VVGAKLQACCINFNDLLRSEFGVQYGLERRLPIALQFVTFEAEHRSLLKRAGNLPPHIEAMIDAFHHGLSEEEQRDPAFAYRVVFIPKVANRRSSADAAIEFVRPDSAEGQEITRVLLKQVDRRRYAPGQIVALMRAAGFDRFTQHEHTLLVRARDARDPAKDFGKPGLWKGSWEWFDTWVDQVRAHCEANRDRYVSPQPA
jgi:hypothetical protein